jgi:hypothetical protein
MTPAIPLNFRNRLDNWRDFALRHAGNPCLALDPLYPLPDDLIDAIEEEVPDFFTSPEELAFERSLARLERSDDDLDARLIAARDSLRQMLGEEMQSRGRSLLEVKEHFRAEKERNDEIESRVEAYAGWLVTNPQFRVERDVLRQRSEAQVVTWGGFPSQPHSYLGEESHWTGPQPPRVPKDPGWTDERYVEEVTKANAPFEDFHVFYRRWCLERFETLDLPRPMRPELGGHTTYDTFAMSEAGLCLFIPWHFIRDQYLTLNGLTRHLKLASDLTHLQDWFKKHKQQSSHVTFRRKYHIYRYLYLALVSRYGQRLRRKTEALDFAFARYLIPENKAIAAAAETIKKTRKELSKLLLGPKSGKTS